MAVASELMFQTEHIMNCNICFLMEIYFTYNPKASYADARYGLPDFLPFYPLNNVENFS